MNDAKRQLRHLAEAHKHYDSVRIALQNLTAESEHLRDQMTAYKSVDKVTIYAWEWRTREAREALDKLEGKT